MAVKENTKGREEQLNPQPMFGDRKTVLEAFEYARMVIDRSTDPSMNVYGTTALMVIWNTLAKNYEPLTRKK
mgnify:FL=1|jgi:hypothetical protein|tara:strand:+ start:61 stop:276 length:216 start_codon:yes stop_codon:yes gene_type:complete